MKKIINKKLLFFILAVGLNLIEFFRNTVNFDIFSVTNNLTGLVILLYILSQNKIKKYIGMPSLCITIAAVVACFFSRQMRDAWFTTCITRQIISAIFNAWWIAIIGFERLKNLISALSKKKADVRIDVLFVIWAVAGIWTVFSRSETFWPVWFLGMFSLFYTTVFSEEDWYDMQNALVTGSIFSYVAFEVMFLPFRPYDIPRYSGVFSNPNNFACYTVIIYLFVLVKMHMLHTQRKHILLKILYSVIGIVLLDISFMTGCRTVWIIEILLTISWLAFVVVGKWKMKIWKTLLFPVAMLAASVILLFPTYAAIRYVPTIHPHPIWFFGEYSDARVTSMDPKDSEKYVEFDEMLDENLGRVGEMIGGLFAKSPFVMVAQAEETVHVETAQTISWLPRSLFLRYKYAMTYASRFNLLGHNQNEIRFKDDDGVLIWHSQNYWIQISYMYGLPFGILMLAAFVINFIRSIKTFRSEDKKGINILPLMFMMLYFVYGLMEITWITGYIMLTLAYLLPHPQWYGKKYVLEDKNK